MHFVTYDQKRILIFSIFTRNKHTSECNLSFIKDGGDLQKDRAHHGSILYLGTATLARSYNLSGISNNENENNTLLQTMVYLLAILRKQFSFW